MKFKLPEEHFFLTEEESDLISQKVINLKSKWISREGFYTLGAASYLDSRDIDVYKKLSDNSNVILRKEFESVYDKIKSFFELKLGKPVKFDLAWPGFHIFEFNKQFSEMKNTQYIASIHVDKPYSNHDWGFEVNEEETFSFTIPVRIPKNGAGLNCFNTETGRNYIEFYNSPNELQEQLLASKNRIDYINGNLYYHEFGLLHQISNDSPLTHGDMRITIQGHGVLCHNEYYNIFF